MRPRYLVLVRILCLALILSTTGTAVAQDFDVEEYKARLDDATEVYKSGDLAAALIAYLEVRSKFSGPEIDYSLARTYHKLYQCDDARVFYEFVMNSYDLPEANPLFQKAANYYTELINCDAWGEVALQCTAGGQLLIDDEPMGACLERPYTLPSGTYTFRLEGEGVEPVEEKVRVTDGENATVQLQLEAKVVEKVVEVPSEPNQVIVKDEPINWLAWSLVGVGAASLTTAAFMNAAGYQAMADVQKAADRNDTSGRASAEDDVALYQILTGVTMGIGVAAAGTGIVLLILDEVGDDEPAPSGAAGLDIDVSAGPIDGGGAIMLQGRF